MPSRRRLQDYDESLSQYWSRFKGLLDSCPNNRMYEAEVYNFFYEGANPESKDLLNSSSGGYFKKKRMSEAREILERLIDAKKTYDSPRTILRRENSDAVNVQTEDRMDTRMDKLEKTILTAIGKNNPPDLAEKAKQMPGPEEGYQCYGQPGDGEIQAQVNAMENWNPNGSWNPGKQMDTPWRDHPNFRWSDNDPNLPPQQQNTNYSNPQER